MGRKKYFDAIFCAFICGDHAALSGGHLLLVRLCGLFKGDHWHQPGWGPATVFILLLCVSLDHGVFQINVDPHGTQIQCRAGGDFFFCRQKQGFISLPWEQALIMAAFWYSTHLPQRFAGGINAWGPSMACCFLPIFRRP